MDGRMTAGQGAFEGRSVLVTGAGSGIGRVAARRFAAEGALVCAVDLQREAAQRVADGIVAAGGRAIACQADVAQPADNQRMVEEAVRRHGGLDVAYLNAGYYGGPAVDLFEAPLSELDHVLAVNLRGCLLGVRAVVPALRVGGAIVVTASAGGLLGVRANPVYAAAKHGIVGLVRSLAPSLGERGLRINAVCPGGVRTAMTGFATEDLVATPDALPLVEYGERAHPEHVAEVALFLASARAGAVNGAAWVVDAGQTSVLAAPPRAA